MSSCNRRHFLLGLCAALAAPSAFAAADESLTYASETLAALEKTSGGRLGVTVVDSSSQRGLAYRAEERFPMCSAFKALAAAALLARVDAGAERLDRKIVYAESDLMSYAPITKTHVGDGMTLGELAAAAIDYSDNTAANLMLVSAGRAQRADQLPPLHRRRRHSPRPQRADAQRVDAWRSPRHLDAPRLRRGSSHAIDKRQALASLSRATRELDGCRQSWRRATARRPAGWLGHRRQDGDWRSRNRQHGRHHSPATAWTAVCQRCS